MDLGALRDGDLSTLGEAITDWSQMVKKLDKLHDRATKQLDGRARKADWAGDNAAVTRAFVTKTAREFGDAVTQATSIRNILRDTRNELIGYRGDLQDALERAHKKKISVVDTGGGKFAVTPLCTPDEDEPGQAEIQAVKDEVQGILNKATESDDTAAQALRALADHSRHGFSNASYKDRDDAAGELKAADEAAELAGKDPAELTLTELSRFNALAAKHHSDPLFAERFATEVGPRRTLELWAGIADPYPASYDPERAEIAKKIQKNLGMTLGTATLSDSPGMEKWEHRMVSLGPERLGTDYASNPRGFQVMSNLMRFGEYDTSFLHDYGDELIAHDKKFNGDEDMPAWANNSDSSDLNYWGKDDRGRDPMNGFLEALGHNPEASTAFFRQPDGAGDTVNKDSEVNAHLKYLTEDRHWHPDATLKGDSDKIAGHDALGHALEAATTGYAYDDAALKGEDAAIFKDGGERRNAGTAGVMEQVAYVYGGKDGPQLLHDQPGMADSLGKMGGAYVDDINYAVSGLGDTYARDEGDFPAAYDGRADFGRHGAISFLSVLGQNETSHAYMTSAGHLYTLSQLDAHPPTNDANYQHAKDVMLTEAEVRGTLDHSRVTQAEATFGAESKEANESISRSTEWKKFAVGATVGIGVAAIPVPGAQVAGAALVPIASETAGGMLTTFLGQEVEKGADEKDPNDKIQDARNKFYHQGENDFGKMYDQYFGGGDHGAQEADREDLDRKLKAQYLAVGESGNKYEGRAPHTED